MKPTSERPTRIWLIRHGEPSRESKGRCYGRLNVGLSDGGRKQLNDVSTRLQNEPITAIYVSPRARAVESGEILGQGRSCLVNIEERLCEIDFGDFEGKSYEEIAQTHPEIYRQWMEQPTEVQFPNGESFRQTQARVLRAAHDLYARHRDETIAIVSHGGVNRILLAAAMGIPDANIFRIAQRYAAVNLIVLVEDYPSIELMNA
jgi:alpha-ribazole phosphatase